MQFTNMPRETSFHVLPPTHPLQLRTILTWNYIEDRSGNAPAEAVELGLIGRIHMDSVGVVFGDNAYTLFSGRTRLLEHPAHKINLENTEHGLDIRLTISNRNTFVANRLLWTRRLTRKELKSVLDARDKTTNTAVVAGELNTDNSGQLHSLHLVLDAALHVVSATIRFPEAVLKQFLDAAIEPYDRGK
jgi:hypothetical protein